MLVRVQQRAPDLVPIRACKAVDGGGIHLLVDPATVPACRDWPTASAAGDTPRR